MSKIKHEPKIQTKSNVDFLDNLNGNYKELIAFFLILLPILVLYLPYQIDNVRPLGSDYLASVGQTHQWNEFQNQTGEQVLWNPNIFMGEPIYSRITPKIISFDTLFTLLDSVFYWVFWYFLLGGIAFYALLRYKKIDWYIAVIATIVFLLLPDWQALVGTGHNSKLRAIMLLPAFILSFTYFFDKKTWLSAGIFAFFFAMLNRTHHFQIVFYGIMILFVVFIYPTIKMLFEKKFKDFGLLIVQFSVALILTFLTAAQPLFTTNEYAQFSTRSGNTLEIDEILSEQKTSGVSFDYATMWSFAPNELMDFFIPHFSGGLSNELYDGEKYPQLIGREIPTYWGDKPSNGNYATVGITLFIFAIFGVYYNKKSKFVIGLAIFVLFSILLSFGKNFPSFYELFFNYLPYFSKFRAPSMILNVTFIVILLLSGFGLQGLIKNYKKEDLKFISTIVGLAVLSLAYIFISYESFQFSTLREQQNYDANTLNALKEIRIELLLADLNKIMIFTLGITATIFLFIFNKIDKLLFVSLVLIISVLEISNISIKAYNQISLQNPDKLEESAFQQTHITNYLKNSKTTEKYRAIVIGNDFTSNYYAYYYPLITGYSAIKMQAIQDIFENSLFKGNDATKINWNLINMLSGKWVILNQQLPVTNFTLRAVDQQRKELLYENQNALPKAYFTKNLVVVKSEREVVENINKPNFSADSVVYVINKPKNLSFSGKGSVTISKYTPNLVKIATDSDENQLLVLAEMYYPKGWIAKVNGDETEILKVNHLLRAIQVPKGKNEIEFLFEPESFQTAISLVWIGNLGTILLIAIGVFSQMKSKRKW